MPICLRCDGGLNLAKSVYDVMSPTTQSKSNPLRLPLDRPQSPTLGTFRLEQYFP